MRNPERRVKSILLSAVAMETAAAFRRRLKKLIMAKYRSLDRFYLETDFSKGHLSDILRGKNSPSVDTLIKLAKALDVEVREFFIFPEKSERDRAIELMGLASQDEIKSIVERLSRR